MQSECCWRFFFRFLTKLDKIRVVGLAVRVSQNGNPSTPSGFFLLFSFHKYCKIEISKKMGFFNLSIWQNLACMI